MSFIWSKANEELFKFDSDILVSASAGTGKTTALIELYCRVLENRINYDIPVKTENILAITFTNKAANEMRERLSEGLRDRKELVEETTLDEQLHSAYIHTFHGFCGRILRKYAFDAGISPDFKIMEPLENSRLFEASINEEIIFRLTHDDELILALLKITDLKSLVKAVKTLISRSEAKTFVIPDIEEKKEKIGRDILIKTYDKYSQTLEAIYSDETVKLTAKGQAALDEAMNCWKRIIENKQLPNAQTEPKVGLEIFKQLEMSVKANTHSWRNALAPIKKKLLDYQDKAKAAYCEILLLPTKVDILNFANSVQERFDAKRRESNLINYDDLQTKTIELLQTNKEIREKLKKHFHLILVDEFQDTNKVQETLINLVRRNDKEAKQMHLPASRVLFVGDRKQSIYGFRGADVSVFRGIEMSLLHDESGGKRLHFNSNFRSTPALLEFFNKAFNVVMSNSGDVQEDYEVGYNEEDDLVAGKEKACEINKFPVEFYLIDSKKKGDVPKEIEARIITERLIDIVENGLVDYPDKNYHWGDIAILLRKMTHASKFEKIFREIGIPYVVSSSSGFYERLEVSDLINVLKFLVRPLEAISRFAVLRSPAVFLSDNTIIKLLKLSDEMWLPEHFDIENWQALIDENMENSEEKQRLTHFVNSIKSIRQRLKYLPVSEVIDEILQELDFIDIAKQSDEKTRILANYEKLLQNTRSWERSKSGFDIDLFLKTIDEIKTFDEREAEGAGQGSVHSLKIMTIHQAKGLEFPIVVVPDLAAGEPPFQDQVIYQDEKNIGMKYFDETSQKNIETLSFKKTKKYKDKREKAEYQRLFYVALTRAKEHLILGGNVLAKNKKYDQKWLGWMENLADSEKEKISKKVYDSSELENLLSKPIEKKSQKRSKEKQKEKGQLKLDFDSSEIAEDKIIGTFSVTLINDLLQCPQKYIFRKILDRSSLMWMQNEADDELEITNGEPNAISAGIMVHKFFENLESNQISKRRWIQFIEEQSLAGKLNSGWISETWSRIENCGEFPFNEKSESFNVYRELPFLANVQLPSGRIIRLKGIIDAVRHFEDGELHIIDYKNTKFSKKKHEKYADQLTLYSTALQLDRENFGKNIKAYIGYLMDDEPWREIVINDEVLNNYWQKVDEVLDKAETLLKNDSFLDFVPECDGDCRFYAQCHQTKRNSLDLVHKSTV